MVTALILAAHGVIAAPVARADDKRLNSAVVQDVRIIQGTAGCTDTIKVNPKLQLAAQWHTLDVLNDRSLEGDVGSDGSTVQSRAAAAGYLGDVDETAAINPALSISGIELINQWYHNPAYLAIMQNCDFTQIGVWTEHRIDRTVVVAVYGTAGS
ncbi:CAP domain-containing protein [Mycobacterium sp. 21AC1]|uniref:CAP domain-containing protein n=1 Tax=[Mycobacterium] appelbergii TaxID=2939269 RepID=UPI0029393B14|nr:CAP domain-containing protein [Mycobacterium sp. 21AC1]MDV3129938.1 CAP domain-containing protein [Mycobacterium sp. 21AC1]